MCWPRDYISFILLCSIGGSQEIAQPRKRLVMSKLGYGCVAGFLPLPECTTATLGQFATCLEWKARKFKMNQGHSREFSRPGTYKFLNPFPPNPFSVSLLKVTLGCRPKRFFLYMNKLSNCCNKISHKSCPFFGSSTEEPQSLIINFCQFTMFYLTFA